MGQESVDFHIQQGDYAGTRATVPDLIGQDMRKHGPSQYAETLSRVSNDLMYLQRSYRIERMLNSKYCGRIVQDSSRDQITVQQQSVSIRVVHNA